MAKYDKLMLSRRVLRVKAMQTLYALGFNDSQNPKGVDANLESSIRNTYRLYVYHFWTLLALSKRIGEARENAAASLLPENQRKVISDKLLRHPFIQSLQADGILEAYVKSAKLSVLVNNTVIGALFASLNQLEAYQSYLADEEGNSNQKIIKRIFTKLMDKSETFQDHLEEHFPNLPDDIETVTSVINNVINQFEAEPENFTVLMPDLDWKEKNDFAHLLVDKSIAHSQELEQLIMEQVANWNADRISPIDKLLLKMALVEMLHCPHIPLKVSINEYIDISKIYSTPKSKEFVNGILDQLQQKLKKEGRIKKEGRGLLDFKVK